MLRRFICVLILAGLHHKNSNFTEWWSDDPMLSFPLATAVMPASEFRFCLRFLHLSPVATMKEKVHAWLISDFSVFFNVRCNLSSCVFFISMQCRKIKTGIQFMILKLVARCGNLTRGIHPIVAINSILSWVSSFSDGRICFTSQGLSLLMK